MMRVIINRQIRKDTEAKVKEALIDLRTAALHQPGYITGETLVNTADPRNILIISTWASLEHWRAWQENQQRIELTGRLNQFLLSEEQTSTYYVVEAER